MSDELVLNPVNQAPLENGQVDILLGTPTLGLITIEWYNCMRGMVAPPNWAFVASTPKGFLVPDAQNVIVDTMLRGKFRAMLLIEDDTCPPPDALIRFDQWFWKMERKKAPPVVSGLYHIKGSAEIKNGDTGGIELLGPEPLMYRGSGTRAFRDWTPGDAVWVCGIPTGALMVHRSIMEAWAAEPDVETYTLAGYPYPLKRIFKNPSQVWVDDDGTHIASGTSDLWWSDQTIKRDILRRAGWPETYGDDESKWELQKKYPYIVDTGMRFGHVDRATGIMY